jgi:hypothetical protein
MGETSGEYGGRKRTLAAYRCNQLADSRMLVHAEVVAAYDLSGGVWAVEFRCSALA